MEWARLEADDWMVVWNAGSWEPGPFDTTYPSGNGYPEPLAIHVQQAVAERLACIAQALDDESAEDYLREVVAALRGIAHLCPLNTDPKQSFEDD